MPKGRYQPGYKRKWKRGERNFSDPQYLTWRKAVKARDKYKCRKCGVEPTNKATLVCHHIRRWADMPTLRFATNNGITLCRRCHKIVTGNEDAYAPMFLKMVVKSIIEKREKEINAKKKTKRNPPRSSPGQ